MQWSGEVITRPQTPEAKERERDSWEEELSQILPVFKMFGQRASYSLLLTDLRPLCILMSWGQSSKSDLTCWEAFSRLPQILQRSDQCIFWRSPLTGMVFLLFYALLQNWLNSPSLGRGKGNFHLGEHDNSSFGKKCCPCPVQQPPAVAHWTATISSISAP